MTTILVWKFADAPMEYRRLSTLGGDEDWLAFTPYDVWEREGAHIPMFPNAAEFEAHHLSNGVVMIWGHS